MDLAKYAQQNLECFMMTVRKASNKKLPNAGTVMQRTLKNRNCNSYDCNREQIHENDDKIEKTQKTENYDFVETRLYTE